MSFSNHPIRIGFVGFGSQALKVHAKYLVEHFNHKSVRVVAVCDILENNIPSIRRQMKELGLADIPVYPVKEIDHATPENISSLEKLIANHYQELDAIIVSTPYAKHYYQVKKSLASGFHVLVDKPLSLNYNNAKELVELAERNDLCLSVSSQRRYELVYRYVKKSLENVEIGKIVAINGIISQSYDWLYGWRNDPAMCGGGALWSVGWHIIDIILYLVNKKVLAVDGALYPSHGSMENQANALIYFEDDVSANITVNHLSPQNSVYERLQIWGTKGTISVDRFKPRYDTQQPQVTHQMADGRLILPDLSAAVPQKWAPTKAFIDYLLNFDNNTQTCKESKNVILSSGCQSLDTVRTIEAIYNSARQKSRILIEQTNLD